MTRRVLVRICYLLKIGLLLVSAGCMVGPGYKRPQTVADTAEGYFFEGRHLRDANDVWPTGRWWERFGDDTTN